MKRCYISGKITGLPESEVLETFKAAAQKVCDLGFVPINPCELTHQHNQTWEEFMREDIKELMSCEAIYMLRGWQKSPGAKIEYSLAKDLKFEVIHEAEPIDFEAKEYQGAHADDEIGD